VIFITPKVAKTVIDAVKLALGGIPSLGDLKSKGAWEAAKIVKEALDQAQAAAELAAGVADLLVSGVVVMPTQPNSEFIGNEDGVYDFGVCPQNINCGILPKPGILWPVCTFSGKGQSLDVLVTQEKGC
jgi:hypothetical protein